MTLDINGMLGNSGTVETTITETKEANAAFNALTGAGGNKIAPTDIFAGLATSTISMNDFDELEAGEYLSTLNKITIKLSSTNSPLGVIGYKVIDGDKANRLAFETLFFAQQDGTLNTKAVGKLAKVLQVVHSTTEDKAIEAAKAILVAFAQGGQKDLVVDDKNGLVANQGNLKISEYKYTPRTGKNAGIERTGRNFTFKAAV